LSISLAFSHLKAMLGGAARVYLINAATMVLYPVELLPSNLHICEWLAGIPDRSVLSKIGAADASSTT
jgi:hypothetical protein